MAFSSIKSFRLELDGPADAVFTSGEVVSGQVVLDLRWDTRVRSMKVLGRGVAMAHWLENRSIGMNSIYNDYTSKITYVRKRQHLIRDRWSCPEPPCSYQGRGRPPADTRTTAAHHQVAC